MAVSLITIREFFGLNAADFRSQWTKLTAEDKAQLKAGFENGTYTY